ncbi:hypothetical protein OGAPHI_004215 [Ogataea philodendri]|uniref:U2 small nuclear ribonucleoprotein A' n=1 Tax=Ogataea philodendri TaxID=1378263 RepID=A0A9P8P6P1_9ASCO|nr:uncharacterized protein OGAPHI_004215 [Ogataea philodendri]KAH3666026.1 hypothetical protein OGAPHI_004215 [Ogataea philodendri]
MRLTPLLIEDAPCYLSAADERTLVLRGLQISFVESFAQSDDVNEALDLTDNDIRVLTVNTPMKRLQTLLLARNQISSIDANIGALLPNLKSLSLLHNNLSGLPDLVPLRHCTKLDSLYLAHNKVTALPYYKEFVIWLLPSVTILDFDAIKPKHRQTSKELLGTFAEPTPLATQLLNNVKLEPLQQPVVVESAQQVRLTDAEKEALKKDLLNASSLEEIERIELALQRGYIE